MHAVLEEAAFLVSAVVEEDQAVFNWNYPIVHALELSVSMIFFSSFQGVRTRTYVEEQEPAVRLVHDARLDEREFLLGVLLEVCRVGVAVLLGEGGRDPKMMMLAFGRL